MDLDRPIASVAEAATIAQLGPRTARGWIAEGLIGWKTDRLAEVAGATTILSARSTMALSIASSLAAIGMSPKTACRAAREFTDFGEDGRLPGELFKKGLTALVAYPDGEAKVLVADKVSLFDAFISDSGRKPAACILYLGDVVKRVEIALQKLETK